MSPRARVALVVAGGVLASACAPTTTAPPVPETPASAATCLLTADSAGPARPVNAVFDDTGDARRAERAAYVVSPVRLDCEGRPLPGLATAWSRDTSGRFWTLELARAPRADSGIAWTPGALAATWRADPDAAAALRFAGIASLLPLDDRRLMVGFSAPEPTLPPVFSDRSLGVAGTARPESPVSPRPSGNDLRDAVDGGVDLVHTSDPDLLEYASHRPGLTTVALPWDRAYLLLLPRGSAGVGAAIPADTSAFRAALARDAVRADARPAETAGWWAQPEPCRREPAPPPPGQAAEAVVYGAADRVARDLAERIVALASLPSLTARGLDDASFRETLLAGSARGYVVTAPVHAAVPCRESAGWPVAASAIPLIETRPHAILRRGTPRLGVEWDGTVVSQ